MDIQEYEELVKKGWVKPRGYNLLTIDSKREIPKINNFKDSLENDTD